MKPDRSVYKQHDELTAWNGLNNMHTKPIPCHIYLLQYLSTNETNFLF